MRSWVLGFTLVYRTMRMVNFAQGHVFMAGTFLGLVIAERVSNCPALPLIVVVGAVAFLIGIVLERLVFRRLYHNHEVFVVGSIGLGIVLTNGVRILFPEPVPFPKVFGTKSSRSATRSFQDAYLWVVGLHGRPGGAVSTCCSPTRRPDERCARSLPTRRSRARSASTFAGDRA